MSGAKSTLATMSTSITTRTAVILARRWSSKNVVLVSTHIRDTVVSDIVHYRRSRSGVPMKQTKAIAILTTAGLCAAWSITSASQSVAATSSFTYTGALTSWTAPATGLIQITAVGAGGSAPSDSGPSLGGNGAVVVSVEAVRAGEVLNIRIGGGASGVSAGGAATSAVRADGSAVVVAGGGGGGKGTANGGSAAATNSRAGGNGTNGSPGLGGNGNVLSGRGGTGGGTLGGAGGTQLSPNGGHGTSSSGGGGGSWNGGSGGLSSFSDPGGTSESFGRQTTQFGGGGGAGFGGGGGGYGGAGGGGYGGGGGGGISSGGGGGGSFAAETGNNSGSAAAQYYPAPLTVGGSTFGEGGTTIGGARSGGNGYLQITTLSVAPFSVTGLKVGGKATSKKRNATWTLPRTNIATSTKVRLKQKGKKGYLIQRNLGATATKATFKRKTILKTRKSSRKTYILLITTSNSFGTSSTVKKAFKLR